MAEKLEKVLDVFLQNSKDKYFLDYDKMEDTILRYKLHRHLKGVKEVQSELYANLHIRELRLIAVEDAIKEKNYSEAERLCLEAIEKEGEQYLENRQMTGIIYYLMFMLRRVIRKSRLSRQSGFCF